MTGLRFLLPIAAAATALGACSAEAPGEPVEAVGTAAESIVYGETSPSNQDAAVLLIHLGKDGTYEGCTGTLIAPNLLLTARHCVSKAVDQAFYCDADGTLQAAGPGGGTVTGDYSPAELYVFIGTKRPNFQLGGVKAAAHGKTIFHDDSKVLCGNDIALLLLDTEIHGASIAPVRLERGIAVGEKVTAVGWGATTSTDTPLLRQQRTGIAVRHVGPFGKGSDAAVPANDFSVGESICAGDSGGPAFSEETGAVIGVVSRGGNGTLDPSDISAACIGTGTINHYTQTAPFKDLILSAFQAANAEAWEEEGPDPRLAKFGVACGGNDECRSNICDNGTCGQSCETEACPSGFECKTEGATKLCRAPNNASGPHAGNGCALGGGDSSTGLAWVAFAVCAVAVSRRRRARD